MGTQLKSNRFELKCNIDVAHKPDNIINMFHFIDQPCFEFHEVVTPGSHGRLKLKLFGECSYT